jgi:hypothetical protein
MDENKLYSAIEHAIIKWVIDGTKTAGSLTRDIMLLVEQMDKEQMDFIKRCITVYWEYHSNRVHPDNQNDWNISQSIINDTLSKQQDNA